MVEADSGPDGTGGSSMVEADSGADGTGGSSDRVSTAPSVVGVRGGAQPAVGVAPRRGEGEFARALQLEGRRHHPGLARRW